MTQRLLDFQPCIADVAQAPFWVLLETRSQQRAKARRRCSGQGRVYTYCVQYQTAVPFVTVIVELVEGPRLMSILVDVAPDPAAVRCDMPVEVAFVDRPDGQSLPVFRPASPVSR